MTAKNRLTLAFGAIYLIWGATYLAIRVGVREWPPFMFTAVRHLLAGPLMLAISWSQGNKLTISRSELKHALIAGTFLLVFANGGLFLGEKYVSSSVTSLLIATTPFWMVCLELLRSDGERLKPSGWAGFLLGFVGVALLIGPGLRDFKSEQTLGCLIILGSAIFWAVGSFYSKYHSVKTSVITITAYEMCWAGIALSAIAIGSNQWTTPHLSWQGWFALFYLVVIGSLLGYTVYLWLLRNAPITKVSTYAYVNPMVAVILGILVLKEPFNGKTFLSMTAILLGVYLVLRSPIKKPKPIELPQTLET